MMATRRRSSAVTHDPNTGSSMPSPHLDRQGPRLLQRKCVCCYRQEAMPSPDRPFEATMCYLDLHTLLTHSFKAVFCRKLADV